MPDTFKALLAVIVCVTLSACAGQPTQQPAGDQGQPEAKPEVTERDTDTGETEGLGEGDDEFQGHALEDPDSLLSERLIYFDFDKSNVKQQYQPIVAAHAEYLANHPGARVTLEGHADERGTREYNRGLGERRGKSVAQLLTAQGARPQQITVVSYGEEQPVATCSNESCWSQNRRVEIVYTRR